MRFLGGGIGHVYMRELERELSGFLPGIDRNTNKFGSAAPDDEGADEPAPIPGASVPHINEGEDGGSGDNGDGDGGGDSDGGGGGDGAGDNDDDDDDDDADDGEDGEDDGENDEDGEDGDEDGDASFETLEGNLGFGTL